MISLYRVLKNNGQPDSYARDYVLNREFKVDAAGESEEIEAELQPVPEKVMGEAEQQAERILEIARRGAEQIQEKAWREGFSLGEEEGYKVGVEKAAEENRQRIDREIEMLEERVGSCIKEVGTEKEKILETYIDDLKNIALSIGEKIVQTSLKSSEQVIERMILAATEKHKKSAWAKIYIGSGSTPMDIQGDAEFLRNLSKLADNVKVIMMDQEENGTCIVELPDEIIDISIATQLENIKEILNNARL